MKESFRTWMSGGNLTDKGVTSRMSKARKAEITLGYDLDYAVSNDDRMYNSLVALQVYEDSSHNPMQNAVRKYYKFINGKEFPRLNKYRTINVKILKFA